MNKFGLIDVFTKLAQDKNTVNNLSSVIGSLFNSNFKPNEKATSPLNKNTDKYSQNAIFSLLKRHDELSKQIDMREKQKPPKT